MRTLTIQEVNTIEKLFQLNQNSLLKTMNHYLKNKYDNVIATKDYIIAVGDIPVGIVAHADTVFKKPPQRIFYDERKNVMWSPEGLGADDRAGIFAIIQILKMGLRPTVIITADEEIGGLGASSLIRAFKKPPTDLKYLIQLDRRDSIDCVFYDCDNKDFVKYVESFGFKENWGTFSDISYLAPDWGVSAVNLSIGYKDEHSVSEVLHVDWMYRTIERVKTMLDEEVIPYFEYVENPYTYAWLQSYYSHNGYYGKGKSSVETASSGQVVCPNCHSVWDIEDTYPVEIGENTYGDYCLNCIALDKVHWCSFCGDPFIPDAGQDNICRRCESTYAYKDKFEEGAV